MSNEHIANFYEFESLHSYLNIKDEKVYDDGCFRKGLDKYINSPDVMQQILLAITKGNVDIFRQERIFSWLDKWHHAVWQNPNHPICTYFYNAMHSLELNTDKRFKSRGYRSTMTKTELSELQGYGDFAIIDQMILTARYLANREAYKHFGVMYGFKEPYNVLGIPTKLTICIRNPKYQDFAKDYAGKYRTGATIKQIDENLWVFNFDDYYLSTDSEHQWNFTLWKKIFIALKPLLEKTLLAEIYYKSEWEFND